MRRQWPVTLCMVAVMVGAGLASASAQQPPRPVNEQQVYDVASQLRCVVCQNLSVADSPSEMANQMRALVRERLATGETPDQVIQYFVGKYGQWILLEPRRSGFALVVWVVPVVAVVLGLAIAVLVLRSWTRRRAAAASPPAQDLDPAVSARIRRELEAE